jgi:hypothetical protein
MRGGYAACLAARGFRSPLIDLRTLCPTVAESRQRRLPEQRTGKYVGVSMTVKTMCNVTKPGPGHELSCEKGTVAAVEAATSRCWYWGASSRWA